MTVIIAGAGIGGLTAALTCHQLGIPVKVFEQFPEIAPLGVGINLQPHSVRELYELGLEHKLESIGIRTREVAYFSKKGLPIWSEQRGTWAGYNWPQYSVHRGKLQVMLFDAVRERLGPDCVETNCTVGAVEQDDGVTVILNDGRRITGDILIGADGISSNIRAQFYPNEGPPAWGGALLWRGVTHAKTFLSGATMGMAGHQNQKFVVYPIGKPDPETGDSLINWIAELRYDPAEMMQQADYKRQGKLSDFMPEFEDWKFDWLDIPALVRGADVIHEYPMIDRDPLDQWTFGNTTLLGDAAHAMYPIGSNGASQAIIDARVLGKYLALHGLTATALQAYEAERRPVTNALITANRGNGPDQVMQWVEERSGGQFDRIEDVLSTDELAKTAESYKKVAGFDVDILNNAPSIVGA